MPRNSKVPNFCFQNAISSIYVENVTTKMIDAALLWLEAGIIINNA